MDIAILAFLYRFNTWTTATHMGRTFLYPLFNGTFNISLTPGVYYLVFYSFLLGYNTIVYVTNTIRLIPETK
jgi:hypothetical protein